jgi:hypothetical protein
LLDVFCAKNNDGDVEKIIEPMDELYLLLRDVPECAYLFQLASNKILSLNEELGFTVLFSYSYFQHFHPFIRDILSAKENVNVNENEHYQTLLSMLLL